MSETVQDRTKVTMRTNSKLHTGMHFRFIPKSKTFGDLECTKCTLAEKNRFMEPTSKNLNADRHILSATKCR